VWPNNIIQEHIMTQTINGQEYMQDAQGRLVPAETVRPIDKERDALVREKVFKAQELQKFLRDFKYALLDDIEAFLDLSAERYGVKMGGRKGNVTLESFDGAFQIQRQISDRLVFDEGLQAAKVLVDECMRDWTATDRPETRTLIDYAFQVDKEGRINTGRILGLRRLDIQDERWQRAMNAISESLRVSSTKVYVRVLQRDAQGKYSAIPLDLASL